MTQIGPFRTQSDTPYILNLYVSLCFKRMRTIITEVMVDVEGPACEDATD